MLRREHENNEAQRVVMSRQKEEEVREVLT